MTEANRDGIGVDKLGRAANGGESVIRAVARGP